jgi:hypothetical protein
MLPSMLMLLQLRASLSRFWLYCFVLIIFLGGGRSAVAALLDCDRIARYGEQNPSLPASVEAWGPLVSVAGLRDALLAKAEATLATSVGALHGAADRVATLVDAMAVLAADVDAWVLRSPPAEPLEASAYAYAPVVFIEAIHDLHRALAVDLVLRRQWIRTLAPAALAAPDTPASQQWLSVLGADSVRLQELRMLPTS